jgi:DNA-binding MarR family transcriptional regulator
MEMCAAFYAHLISIVPGSTSVNELRLLTAIGLATFKDQHVGVTELSTQLGIPLSTASRLVAKLCEDGRVVSIKHPRDDRRRSLRFSVGHMGSPNPAAANRFSPLDSR